VAARTYQCASALQSMGRVRHRGGGVGGEMPTGGLGKCAACLGGRRRVKGSIQRGKKSDWCIRRDAKGDREGGRQK